MYEREGRGHARGYSPSPVRHEPDRSAPTPAERTTEAVLGLERCVESATCALDAVDAARAANDPERWNAARPVLDERLREASRALERAKLLSPEAGAQVAARLEASMRALEDLGREAASRTEAPSGLVPVAREAEILALLAKPVSGSIAAGYAQKEAALLVLVARLDVKDCRALSARLRRARENDPLAAAFERIERGRQARILGFLDEARRREWERRERERRRPPRSERASKAPERSPISIHEDSPASETPSIGRDAQGAPPAAMQASRDEVASRISSTTSPAARPLEAERPSSSGAELPFTTAPSAESGLPGMGARLSASGVARYLGDGLFELDRTGLRVEVRRTHRSSPRVECIGGFLVLELPRGLSGTAFEDTLVGELLRLGSGEDGDGASEPERARSGSPSPDARPLGDPVRRHQASADDAPLMQQPVPSAGTTLSGAPRASEPHGFEVAPAAPADPIITTQIVVDALPKELRASLPAASRTITLSFSVEGNDVLIALQTDDEVRIARIEARSALEILVAGRDALAQLGDALAFFRGLRGRILVSGTRVRVPLWGHAPEESFAVFDLVRAASGLGRHSAAGFRPVEAQLLLGKLGGVRVFGGPDMPEATAIPGHPIGDWFPVPDDGTIRSALGLEGKGEVHGGVFYERGVLRVAVKPTPEATTGIAAHIDLAYLLEQLKKLGARFGRWIDLLLGRLRSGAVDFFKALGGLLRFELPDLGGTWFEFDFKLQLPRLFKGGGGRGFSLAGLWPSGFHFDFGGFSFGGLPRWKLPWLKLPRLGGFSVPWPKVQGLLGGLPSFSLPSFSLPSIGMPSFPDLDFGLHWPGGFKLGLGIDLSKLWPDLDFAFGFELDLEKLLGKLSGIGDWLLGKLRGFGAWANHWIHLGRDGVLRIYDDRVTDGPMLGFHLFRLLDGADPTDLTPTEMRWNPTKDGTFSLQMGEAGVAGAAKDPKTPKGKVAPVKPEGHVVTSKRSMTPPPSLVTAMALSSGAKVDAEVIFHDRDRLTVWTEAPSAVYDRPEAVRASVSLARIGQAILRLPQAHGLDASKLGLVLDEKDSADGPKFLIGPSPGASGSGAPTLGKAPVPTGHVGWKLERLIGLTDWTELVPDRLELHVDGAGGVQLGKLRPPSPLLDPPGRFELEAPVLRQKLLLANDALSTVWAGVHLADDLIAVSITKSEISDEGALAQVHLSFLLRQLERLGAVGRAILDRLASIALPQSSGKSDVFARLAELARAIRAKFLKLVNGLLSIEFPGGFLRWNLKTQLPHLGEGFDLAGLFPEFSFELPSLPDLSLTIAFQPSGAFGNPFAGFRIPLDGLRKHLGGIPGLDLGKLVPMIDVAWLGDLLAVSLRVGNLFGDGERSFGFQVPVDALLDTLRRAGRWVGGKASALRDHVHIGSDGVLRVFDPAKPHGNRIGFDLTRLFDGISPDDLVPSELHAEVPGGKTGAFAELSIGDARVNAQDEADAARADAERKQHGSKWGKVLVPRPRGEQVGVTVVPAPAAVRGHLGLGDAARIHVSLYLTADAAAVYATADESDRGLSLTVHVAALEQLLKSTFAASAAGPDAKKPRLDRAASRARGMLVVSFGDPAKGDHAHGYAAWRIPRLLEDPSLSSLVPDEAQLARKEGSLLAGLAIDVSHLRSQGTIDLSGWEFARTALGGHDKAEVLTNDLRGDARIALVAFDPDAPAGKRPGIELALRKDFVASLHRRARELADGAGRTVRRVLHKTDGAGAIDTRFAVRPSPGGISIERGAPADHDHLYARYGWHRLAELVGGTLDASSLVPEEFRLATKAMAVEVKKLSGVDKKLPEKAREIRTLHPILRDALVGFGLSPSEWIDLARSQVKRHDATQGRLAATGHVYDVAGTGARDALTVTGGKQVELELDVQALIAQVIPKKKGWNKAHGAPRNAHGWSSSVSMKPTSDINHDGKAEDPGIEISAELEHRNKEGKLSAFRVEAGWSLDQLLELLLHMEQVQTANGLVKDATAAGYLAPARLKGELGSDRFRLSFGNDGRASEYNCHATDVPGLPSVLGYVLDETTIRGAKLHLELPGAGPLAGMVKKAALGGFVALAGCALEVPGPAGTPSRFYQLTFSVRPDLFKAILKLIPVAGEIYMVVSAAIDVLKDPAGAVEALAYTPEALFQILESAPEVFDKLKEKGLKGIALALAMNSDVSTKKAVLANRIAKLRQKLPATWKKGDPKPPDLASIPDDYLEWVGRELAAHPEVFAKLDELTAKLGEDALAKDAPDYTIPGALPSPDEIDARIAQVEKGFTDYGTAREAAKQIKDPEAAKRELAEKAASLRKNMDKILRSGAKPSATPSDHTGQGSTKQPDATDRDYTNVDDLPLPSQEQEDLAAGLFKADDSGSVAVSVPESRYLVQKYAALSAEQLGELLSVGTTMVTTKSGARRALILIEAERDFVRTLFAKGAAAKGVQIKVGVPGTPGADDRHLVAAYHSAALSAARKSAQAARTSAKSGDAKRDGGTDSDAGFADDIDTLEGGGEAEGDDGTATGTASRGGAKHDGAAAGKTAPESGKGTGGGAAEHREVNADPEADAMERAINDRVARYLARWDEAAQKLTLDEAAAALVKKEWDAPAKSGFAMRISDIRLLDEGPAATGLRAYAILATFRIPTGIGADNKTQYRFEERRFQFFFNPATKGTLSEKRDDEYLAQLRALAAQVGDDGANLTGKTIATSRWKMVIVKAERDLMRVGTTKVATALVMFRNVKSQGDRMRNLKGEFFIIVESTQEEVRLPLLPGAK